MSQQLAKEFNFTGLIKFALPTMAMMVIMSLYTVIDALFVSNFINTNALAAINIVYPVISIIVSIAVMLSSGGSAFIARKLGLGETDKACSAFTTIIITGVCLGLAITVFASLFINQIIIFLGASPLIFEYCKDYLGILLLFAPITLLQLMFQAYFVTAGHPSLGLKLTVIAGCLNAVLDYLFIVQLDMGISGAALATGIGQLVPSIAGIIFFFKTKGTLRFIKPFKVPGVLLKSCSNGSSEMVTNLSIAVTSFLFNLMMMKYLGEDGVAAMAVILYVHYMLNSLYIGFSMGVAPIISYNYGSENKRFLKKIFKMCMIIIGISSIMVFLIAMLLSGNLIALFTSAGTSVYQIAATGFLLFSINFIFSGYNIYASALYTAFSNGRVSAFLSFMRTFVFITMCLMILPEFLDVEGIFLAIPMAELLTFILSVIFFIRGGKTYNYA